MSTEGTPTPEALAHLLALMDTFEAANHPEGSADPTPEDRAAVLRILGNVGLDPASPPELVDDDDAAVELEFHAILNANEMALSMADLPALSRRREDVEVPPFDLRVDALDRAGYVGAVEVNIDIHPAADTATITLLLTRTPSHTPVRVRVELLASDDSTLTSTVFTRRDVAVLADVPLPHLQELGLHLRFVVSAE